MRFTIIVNNETLDDELLMLDLYDLSDGELLVLLKMLSVKEGTNKDAYYKIKQWGEDYNIKELVEYKCKP